MNEREIAKKITGYLDHGTAELKAGVAYKLQLARHEALARVAEPKKASELALSGAGTGTVEGGRHLLADARLWIGILLIVGSVVYYQ